MSVRAGAVRPRSARRLRRTKPRSSAARVLAAAALGLLTVACGDPSRSAGAVEPIVRDSAGVTIVENPGLPEGTQLWTLGAEPLFDVGVVDGAEAYQLFRVGGAARIADGRVAVLDGGSGQLRVYTAGGVHMSSAGAQGDGPGEFRSPQAMYRWPGDSLAIWDAGLRRITLVDATGALGRQLTLPDHFDDVDDVRFPSLGGILDDGSLAVYSFSAPRDPRDGMARLPIRVLLLDADGGLVADLGEHPGQEALMRVGENAVSIMRTALSRTWVLAAAGDAVMITPSDRFELRFWSRDGSLARIVRLGEPVRLTTAGLVEAELVARTEGLDAQQSASLRMVWDGITFPDTVPALAGGLMDGTGLFWVRPLRLEQDDGPEPWVVLDRSGRALGRVLMPAGLDVYEIGEDYVLGRATNALDVEHVRMWALDRSGAPDA